MKTIKPFFFAVNLTAFSINIIFLVRICIILILVNLIQIGFKSYLEERTQCVYLNPYKIKCFEATSGVSQGSALGPLLFNIFINDILETLDVAPCLLYADDIKLLSEISNTHDCVQLQSDINKLHQWSNLNNLPFTVNKCKCITYSGKAHLIHHWVSYTQACR